MELQTAKGVRDFSPEHKIARDKIVNTLRKVFELYGYNPLETPVIERFDVLSSKYAGGEEILKETFTFRDQGNRELALRYDLTVPMCRFVGMNPNLKMPFKRYQLGDVFRDGPIKLGRYRQFAQCDVDIVGCKEMIADAEILALAERAFRELKLDAYIKVNNRKLLNGILEEAGITENKEDIILTIDKLEKISIEDVQKELDEKGLDEKTMDKLFSMLRSRKENAELLKELRQKITNAEGREGIAELESLFEYLKQFNVRSVKLDISLARGLSYYTGTVFECFMKKSEIKSSIAAGGRYDRMIGKLLQSTQEYPAVGISFGLDVIADAMSQKEKKKTVADVFVIPIKAQKECIPILEELRAGGIRAEMDIMGRGISKNLTYANSYAIPFVIIIGEEELKQKKVKLKNMKSGTEELVSVKWAVEKIKG